MPARMADPVLVGDEDLPLVAPDPDPWAATQSRRPSFWVLRRLLWGALTVLVVSLIVFVVTQALPSDPAHQILGKDATPASVAALRDQLHLNRPLVTQYVDWLGNIGSGNFGTSLAAQIPVSRLIGPRIGNSFLLVLLSAIVAIPLAVILGALSAFRRDGLLDRVLLGISLGFTAVPEFVVGLLLVMVFSTSVLTILPAVAALPSGSAPLDQPDVLILPVTTLTLAIWPYLYRLVRASMIDVLDSDYVQQAELKGMPQRIVVLRHALPNALVPTIQASGFTFAYLLGGVVVVEYIFAYPGLGSALLDAVNTRDLPVIQAIIMVFATSYVLYNIFADVLTVYVSPRLRTGGR